MYQPAMFPYLVITFDLRSYLRVCFPPAPYYVDWRHVRFLMLFPNVTFNLSAWGAAGLFGGEEAISAIALIPLFQGGRWFGWYNSPGSLKVARHFGGLLQSQFSERLLPSMTKRPANPFVFDGQVGPQYISVFSGTEMQTGYLGYLTLNKCKEVKEETKIPGRETIPTYIALVDMGELDHDDNLQALRLPKITILFSLIPIIVSVAACITCALASDWYSFLVILVGIFAAGIASMTIGSGKLHFHCGVKPAPGSPPGDGVLIGEGIVVVVKGPEHSVNAITKGKIWFDLGDRVLQRAIIISSLSLLLEFAAQLILIPKGTFIGQLMIVISLCVSWIYNSFLSSLRRERPQTNILFEKLENPPIRKFLLSNRVTMTVFVALLVFSGMQSPSPLAVQKMLHKLIPNDTHMLRRWRVKVAKLVCTKSLSCLELEDEDEDLEEHTRELLLVLIQDAKTTFEGYLMTKPFEEGSGKLHTRRGGKMAENLQVETASRSGLVGSSRVPAELKGNTLYFVMEELDSPLGLP